MPVVSINPGHGSGPQCGPGRFAAPSSARTAVSRVNIGPKRVHLTAYCPDDELGLLACEFVCRRAAELLDGTTADELWSWLIARDPEYAELKRLLDAGWRLPKNGDYTVDPRNVLPELRIIRHLMRERLEQCAGRPIHELAMDAAGPIVAPAWATGLRHGRRPRAHGFAVALHLAAREARRGSSDPQVGQAEEL